MDAEGHRAEPPVSIRVGDPGRAQWFCLSRSTRSILRLDQSGTPALRWFMPRSMTGFSVSTSEAGTRRFEFEVRSVNHRYCDVRTHLPSELIHLTSDIEARVRKVVRRGRVDIAVVMNTQDEAMVEPTVDLARARGYKAAYEKLASALGIEAKIDLMQVAQAPGVMRIERNEDETDPKPTVIEGIDEVLKGLVAMRKVEGGTLGSQLTAHLDLVQELVNGVAKLVPQVNAERRRRLDERLSALLDDTKIDPARLAQEAALLADRADVTEEIERLASHIQQFSGLLATDDPVGRKLDFLLQEMNREVNTIGSKSADAELAYLVVDLKTELERLREQVQNLE